MDLRIERIRTAVLRYLAVADAAAVVRAGVNSDGKIDMTVISTVFEGLDSMERETRIWPAFRALDPGDLITMTYCLFLTPSEATVHFSGT